MEKGTLLVGEPMGLFIAQNKGPFEDVEGYSMALAGAEFNVAIGMRRLGHPCLLYTSLRHAKDPAFVEFQFLFHALVESLVHQIAPLWFLIVRCCSG